MNDYVCKYVQYVCMYVRTVFMYGMSCVSSSTMPVSKRYSLNTNSGTYYYYFLNAFLFYKINETSEESNAFCVCVFKRVNVCTQKFIFVHVLYVEKHVLIRFTFQAYCHLSKSHMAA